MSTDTAGILAVNEARPLILKGFNDNVRTIINSTKEIPNSHKKIELMKTLRAEITEAKNKIITATTVEEMNDAGSMWWMIARVHDMETYKVSDTESEPEDEKEPVPVNAGTTDGASGKKYTQGTLK
jgi:hypothetical protein